jgi:uncharacterized protein (TIGR02453 family)
MQKVLHYLSQLQSNNNKNWFDANKKEFEQAKNEFLHLVTELLTRISRFDKSMVEIQAKDCVFRIYRDVRFSNDKTPYKNHFGAFISTKGKKSNGPGYYIHLQPGGHSFIGGGIYMPESDMLAKIRQEIDYNGQKLNDILETPSFKVYFPSLWSEDKLSRPPKGYEASHPFIDYLKLKSFIVSYPIPDKQLEQGKVVDLAEKVFEQQFSLHEFLREALSE